MRLIINRNYQSNKAEIFLVETIGNEKRFYSYNQDELYISSVPIDEIAPKTIKPLLVVPITMLPIICKLFGDEANEQGISTTEENLLKGKLIATERHLEDMREISKHLLKIGNNGKL